MERGRKTKIITIVALVVAIVTMSLGFAVFSNVLTISSSATVTPNEGEFKMKAYGVVDWENIGNADNLSNLLLYASETTAVADVVYDTSVSNIPTATNAVINNSNSQNITIGNLTANFTGLGQGVDYAFILKNEGAYNAYVDFSKFNLDSELGYISFPASSCIAGDGVTIGLVEEACKTIVLAGKFHKFNSDKTEFEYIDMSSTHEIIPGEGIVFLLGILYPSDATLADGPFAVNFDDIVLNFSSTSEITSE